MKLENKIFSKVYGWMFIGLLVSFVTGYYISTNGNLLYSIFSTNMYWILFVIEIGVVIWLSAGIRKMSATTAKILFIIYSILTGLTLSILFIAFRLDSIIFVLGITSIMFAVMAIIGRFTKIDLTKLGSILFIGLIGIVIASIINIFILSQALDLTVTIAGIVIFTLYIAYDIQSIKRVAAQLEEDKAVIICAFELYLDFINLFIKLLRLLGKRKD